MAPPCVLPSGCPGPQCLQCGPCGCPSLGPCSSWISFQPRSRISWREGVNGTPGSGRPSGQCGVRGAAGSPAPAAFPGRRLRAALLPFLPQLVSESTIREEAGAGGALQQRRELHSLRRGGRGRLLSLRTPPLLRAGSKAGVSGCRPGSSGPFALLGPPLPDQPAALSRGPCCPRTGAGCPLGPHHRHSPGLAAVTPCQLSFWADEPRLAGARGGGTEKGQVHHTWQGCVSISSPSHATQPALLLPHRLRLAADPALPFPNNIPQQSENERAPH